MGTRISFWLGGLIVFALLLYSFSGILFPFVAGFAVAYFCDPIVDTIEKIGLPRSLATASVVGAFFALLVVLGFLLAPVIESQVAGFAVELPNYVIQVREALQPLIEKLMAGLGEEQASEVKVAAGKILENALKWLGEVGVRVLSGGAALFNLLSLLLITPVVAFFLLRDWDRIVAQIDGWLPRRNAEVIREQFRLIDDALAGFLRGQATVCLILGALYAIGWSLVGLEFGLVLGLLTGLLAFVPYAGALFGAGLAVAMAFGQFWPDVTSVGLVFGVFVVVQLLEGSLLTPRLIGGRVGLHPVWILFALLAGGNLLGFLGVLIAVPAAAVMGVLVRFGIGQYLESGIYTGAKEALVLEAAGENSSPPAPS
ncbi:MAG: AI-2E family transporter [Sphingomonadales bacterium]